MRSRLWLHWVMLALPVALAVVVAKYVDLQPYVDENFFFATEDPQLRQAMELQKRFPVESQLYLAVGAAEISSEWYYERIAQLTRRLEVIEGVTVVRSIAAGPRSLRDAMQSPLWRRLLIGADGRSTNLILEIEPGDLRRFISAVEAVVAEFDAPDFRVHVAGVPYVTELIRRSLVHDLRYFTMAALVLFGVMVGVMFRSWRAVLGTLASCFCAMMTTLIVQEAVGMKMGILTTNLGTIVFVLTLSHIVFMTSNWRTLALEERLTGAALTWAAWRRTLHPSFWCMATTLMGFGSLLFVPAKPLRDLGVGGVIGTAIAMLCAYTVYPPFLRWAKPPAVGPVQSGRAAFWARRFVAGALIVVAGCAALALGLPRLNTDPSLLDYFASRDPIRQGLDFVDRTGGGNPLRLAVRSADGARLTTRGGYERLWQLHRALERQRDVGIVVSLPVLLAEARRSPLAFFLSWEGIVRRLERPDYRGVAGAFVSKDRREAVFVLRMVEWQRSAHHLEVVARLHAVVRDHGFEPVLTGGVYFLQGHLARQVNHSLIRGLGALIALFTVVALIVALSFRVGVAMSLSVSLVPLGMLGAVGWLGVPVDIISAPAANVCIGMAVDSMIHLVMAVRRRRPDAPDEWHAWTLARQEQWRGIIGSCTIVAVGFAIFGISQFPPTQRFGLAVVFGTAIAACAALFVLPLLGGLKLVRLGGPPSERPRLQPLRAE